MTITFTGHLAEGLVAEAGENTYTSVIRTALEYYLDRHRRALQEEIPYEMNAVWFQKPHPSQTQISDKWLAKDNE